ncbi:hypothetical protein BTJ40_12930 [Microbulbifer sp. A4B17]|nr:hypothetical protein BTJ40_12930 [Microbulbifer sp. A4B17]
MAEVEIGINAPKSIPVHLKGIYARISKRKAGNIGY